jgi:hypothetical protein
VAALCLAVSVSPATAATAPPVLIAPTTSSAHNSPLSVEYELPEAGSAATISFVPTSGPTVVVTLTSPAEAAGKHHFFLSLHELASETANVSKASTSSLPDGEYAVAVSYQNIAKELAATATAEKVRIKTVTATPAVIEPTAGHSFDEPFKVAYALPEAGLTGTVKLVLEGTHGETETLVLVGGSAGSHVAEVIPSSPSSGVGVLAGPTERLPTDSYHLSLSYQDVLGNPAASASVTVGIAYPLCKPGTYSASGEEPCTNAPKGTFTGTDGATKATDCAVGRFAPEEGLTECLIASPGHYVPGTGAKSELECEQGTYSDETGRSACLPAPIGHYAAKGSVTPTLCGAGTHDPHTNSPSAEFCELDAPGSYSGEGAAEAMECEPGKFASASGSEVCLPAYPGSYVSGAGAASATPCPAGSYAPASGSASCTSTPENTYATGGASEPTPCPVGTHAPPGASSCTGTIASTPTITSAPFGRVTTFTITAAKHAPSLRRTLRQRYLLTCSAAATAQIRVSVVVAAGKKHLALIARSIMLSCEAAQPTEMAARFTLTVAARKLLGHRGASVKLTVRVYATGTPAGTLSASAIVPGRA